MGQVEHSSSHRRVPWWAGGRDLTVGVLGGLVTAALLPALGALAAWLMRVDGTDPVMFGILLASAVLTPVLVVVGVLVGVRTDRSARSQRDDVVARLDTLTARLPLLDWSFDAAEHDHEVYRRMREMVEDPRTHEFKVLTIYRDPELRDVSDTQRQAIRDYLAALEHAVAHRSGFVYERMVVIRGRLHERRQAQELFTDLMLARPEFKEHCARVLSLHTMPVNSRGDIHFFADTGRLLDVAFAVSLGQERKPLSLVLEIGMTGAGAQATESQHPALGLLVLENPDPRLVNAFLLAHQSLRATGVTNLERLPDPAVKQVLGITK